MKRPPKHPRIGPCRDPLHLWFLEWIDARGQVWRRYFADRAEARAAIKAWRTSDAVDWIEQAKRS